MGAFDRTLNVLSEADTYHFFLRRVEEVWNPFLSHFPFGSSVMLLLDTT